MSNLSFSFHLSGLTGRVSSLWLAVTFSILWASSAMAQHLTYDSYRWHRTTVVSFSADGNVAVVRWEEERQIGSDEDGEPVMMAGPIALLRYDLANAAIVERIDVVSEADLASLGNEPKPSDPRLAKIRGARWTEAEKKLKKAGFRIDSKLPGLKTLKDPPCGDGSPFASCEVMKLPRDLLLEEDCKSCDSVKDDLERGVFVDEIKGKQTCDLIVKKGAKSTRLKGLFRDVSYGDVRMHAVWTKPKKVAGDWIDGVANAWTSPGARYVIALSKTTTIDGNTLRGARVLDLAKLEADIK